MADVEEYRGANIVIRNKGERCIHSRHCVLNNPELFVPNAPGPWIHPDAAPSPAATPEPPAPPAPPVPVAVLLGSVFGPAVGVTGPPGPPAVPGASSVPVVPIVPVSGPTISALAANEPNVARANGNAVVTSRRLRKEL